MIRLALCSILLLCSLAWADEPAVTYGEPRLVAWVENLEIDESSGVACGGPENPGIFFTHNDSGDAARFFAFDLQGKHRGEWRLKGVKARDWEEITAFTHNGTRWLMLCETGDNERVYPEARLYFVPEPVVGPEPVSVEIEVSRTLRVTYPDGRHDVESVAVAASEGSIYFVVKDRGEGSLVFRGPLEPDASPMVPEQIGRLDLPMTTAMDMDPTERRAVILTYGNAWEYRRADDETWAEAFARDGREIMVPTLRQREAICYGPDGRTLYLTSEKLPTPLIEIPVVEEESAEEGETRDR